ncbi:MAG: transcription termination/antitermination protein NusG [Aquiluna sp.]|nr:transcription termination/antitermination protein NusG [Aquiluna sp.]
MSDLNFSDVAKDAKATEEVEAVDAVDSQAVETHAAELNENEVESTDDAPEAEAEVVEAEAAEEAAAVVEEEPIAEEADPYLKFREELRGLDGKWYVVHSYAGYERRVKQNIETRKAALAGGDDILQIEVPMEESIEIKNGQRKLVSKVRIPGYVLVRMELNEDSWTLVRHTPAVTGFVGNSQHPTPLRPAEAFEMLKPLFTPEETEDVKNSKAAGNGPGGKAKSRSIPVNIDFKIGESILIKDGSFAGLPGTISEIKPESGKVTVLVSLFERETPVELAFDQVGPLN